MGAGCLGSRLPSAQSIQVVPRQLSSYLNQFQAYQLSRLSQKFGECCQRHSKSADQMNFLAFRNFFSELSQEISQQTLAHLYEFFNEDDQKYIPFRQFVSRLAILLYSPTATLNKAIFNLYDVDYRKAWNQQNMEIFRRENVTFLLKPLEMPVAGQLPLEQFVHMLHQENFDYQAYRRQFTNRNRQLKDQEELCSAISRLVRQSQHPKQQEWLPAGQKVYVLSWRWFEKWKLYIESSKFTTRTTSGKKLSYQPEGAGIVRSIAEKPLKIDNSELEGEFQGELLANIILNHHYLLVREVQWRELYSIYGGGPVFERSVIERNIVELYPLTINLLVCDKRGKIDRDTLAKKRLSCNTKLSVLMDTEIPSTPNSGPIIEKTLFYKNLGDKEWREQLDASQIVKTTNLLRQAFVVIVPKTAAGDFFKRYKRDEVTVKNVDYADRVLALSIIENDSRPAYIMDMVNSDYLVHYLSSPYTYNRRVKSSQIDLEKAENSGKLPPMTKKKKQFRGIKNMGNTCFINAVFQCLLGVSHLTRYLANKKQFKLLSERSKKSLNLASCLAAIVGDEAQNEPIDSQALKAAISKQMPSFEGSQQHDAQQFLSLFLNNLADELKLEQVRHNSRVVLRNIINELFEGSSQNTITCKQCQHQRTKLEQFFTLSIPIPEAQFDYFRLLVFPTSFSKPDPMVKIGFKLPKNSTLDTYLKEFQKIVGRSSQDYYLIEVYSSGMNRIINLKSNMQRTLSQIYLRTDTTVVAYEKNRRAYEMRTILSDFQRSVAKGEIIDYLKEVRQEIWSFGKVEEIVQDEQQGKTMMTLSEGVNGRQTIEYFQEMIAPFLSKTHLNQAANLKVIHRKFNAGTGKIQVFGLPFIATVPAWAKLNEIEEIIKKQIHHFLLKDQPNENSQKHYRTVREFNTFVQNMARSSVQRGRMNYSTNNQSTKNIGNSGVEQLRNQTSDVLREDEQQGLNSPTTHTKRSKELKADSEPPYKLIVLNQKEQACPRCNQPNESHLKPAAAYNCTCTIEADQPFSWQYQLPKCVLAIDWRNILHFNLNYATEMVSSPSYTQTVEEERADIRSLRNCLEIFSQPEEAELRCQKCQHSQCTLQTSILHEPAILIIHLKRFKYEDKYLIKLENRIRYEFQLNLSTFTVEHQPSEYELFAVTCHIGTGSQGHYISYVLRQHPIDRTQVWVLYDDDEAAPVSRQRILELPAYLLFYRRKSLPMSTYVNYELKPAS